MSKYKPGDIVTIKGTEFAVLDVEKGAAPDGEDKLFLLLKEPVGSTAFNRSKSNDYTDSELYKAVQNWFYEDFAPLLHDTMKICARRISLLTMDGRLDYGTMDCLAAPLTFDEYRKYSKFIPDCNKASWLVTGYGAPKHSGATLALGMLSDGDWGSTKCSYLYAVRPAMWVSEELIDTPEKPDLSEYSTMALLQELVEREMRNG